MNELSPAECLSTLRISIADMVSLKVRAKANRSTDLPSSLFQSLPERCMALIATIPRGLFAVSLPGRGVLKHGYPILEVPAPVTGGVVAEYERRPNGRYEAVSFHYQGWKFGFREFIPIAWQQMEQNSGVPKLKPNQYAYFAPSIEGWEGILRDSGYTGWDLSCFRRTPIQRLYTERQSQMSSGLQVRIPLYEGEKRQDEVLPVFARVEVGIDPAFNRQPDWISYEEYQKIRSDQSRLPEAILPNLRKWLERFTGESGFQCWIFRPGMLFGDRTEWWGEGTRRRTEHEGIDFALGRASGGRSSFVQDGVPVRSLAKGNVVAILDDFIGKTIVVSHPDICRPNGDVFHTLLSHIRPQVDRLDSVSEGQIVGNIGKTTNTRAPLHLHLAAAWIPPSLSGETIQMDHIHPAFVPVTLVSFMDELKANPLCCFEMPARE